MNRPLPKPARDRHLAIYDEDWEFITQMWGKPDGLRPVGAANVIRAIVHRAVREFRVQYAAKLGAAGTGAPGGPYKPDPDEEDFAA